MRLHNKKILVVAMAVILVIGCFTGCGHEKKIQGIDVSAYQGEINWPLVASGNVEFAMIRCGYSGKDTGEIHLDRYFYQNIEGALKEKLDVGLYFFSQAISVEEAKREAKFVASIVGDYELNLPIAFDMEPIDENDRIAGLTIEEKTQIADAFCQAIEDAGFQAMIYGNEHWLAENINLQELDKFQLWVADYSETSEYSKNCDILQSSNAGSIDGIDGKVDINRR